MKTFYERVVDEFAEVVKEGKVTEEKAREEAEKLKKRLEELAMQFLDHPMVKMPVGH